MRSNRLRVGDELRATLHNVGVRPKAVRGKVLALEGSWLTLSTITHAIFHHNLDIEEVIFAAS